ncbi:hypothetical protein Caci_1319 [Catenulispora acidiphila DSM 44928]|uniref:Uncharacterized protein n=1 Tax=Catenulispora acidiphila (strain DSM 44928 / JCM 14897 / NBRC 102108 / NRRL B-24433 / ID139908) TaxID=479433 RepID=C7Q7F5_CATAD|nr:hypothetical protein [Catenulispora acidiphila]ACU70243.1 hypothetical protein Caci_1319 [Catenulispora acidiphila DSM 44928]
MSKKKNAAKARGTFGTLFAIGSSVTLAPVLARRFKEARVKGDKLALADAAVSAAALTVGVLQVLRSRRGAGKNES